MKVEVYAVFNQTKWLFRCLKKTNFRKIYFMATVMITGGTGLIGKALGQALCDKGYHVVILTRQTEKISSLLNLSYTWWDVEKQAIDKEAFAKADYIIHLAGAGVADKRWTKKRKQEIADSRINSSKLIVNSLKTIPNRVKAVLSASAIGWYGTDLIPNPSPRSGNGGGLRKFVESDSPANDFLGDTCKQWEESIEPVKMLGKRLVKFRIGIVLSKDGGALQKFMKPLKYGIAVILGSGRQTISWIHIDDMVRMYIAAIEDEEMNGVYNAVAPNPVSNKELTLRLAKNKWKFFIPVYMPSFVLKWIFGEMSSELLKSTTVSSDKILRMNFQFKYSGIKEALAR